MNAWSACTLLPYTRSMHLHDGRSIEALTHEETLVHAVKLGMLSPVPLPAPSSSLRLILWLLVAQILRKGRFAALNWSILSESSLVYR